MNPNVDQYLIDGCGRCPLYKTAECKVNKWRDILIQLRKYVNESDLVEDYKWSQPCYTYQNKNVLIVSAFKDYAFISFFKGTLLKDPLNLLSSPGPNSQATKQLRYTTIDQAIEQASHIKNFITEAIQLEKKGAKVTFKKKLDFIPEELQQKFEEDPTFEKAFKKLTPGRQRGYLLHFASAKQSNTRMDRINKSYQKILNGEGINDYYKSKKK